MGKKYYLREMRGSFEVARLILRAGHPGEDDERTNEILAHCMQVPDSSLTHALMPDCTDFGPHWFKGPDYTYDKNLRGGHHCGECEEVPEEIATKILAIVEDK